MKMAMGARPRKPCRFLLLAIMLIFAVAVGAATARERPASSDATIEASVHPLTREDIAGWLDGMLPYAIQEGDIAGGVVSIVKDGRVIFSKGYGYADVAGKRRMDPENTIIRPGSISKLFVWTAVMQLVEAGKLDLDADVNRYLDFRVPAFDGRPITLRDLVTHRSGFADQFKGIITSTPPVSLDRYVKAHLPRRIYPAGAVPAYSNYGTALAAYIVERVSGERFKDYAALHILTPLDMDRSTFAQPVPTAWRANLALGYGKASEAPRYYEYIGPFPAGGLNTTADDMARFMIAHLGQGVFNGQRILSSEAARAMHAPQRKTFPALNAMAVGFYETTRNGHRSIAHNGGTQFFHSDLHLLVDDNVGIFISLNSSGNESAAKKIHEAFFGGFMDRYFPAPESSRIPVTATDTARTHAKLLEGYWEFSQKSSGSWLSLANLFNPVLISAEDDGRISFPFVTLGLARWTETAPFVWQSTAGDKMQLLTRNARPVMIGFDALPPAALLPVPWWRSPGWLLPALGFSLALLILYGLALPVGAVIRKYHGIGGSPAVGKLYHRVPKLLSLGLALAALAYPILLSQFSSDLDYFTSRTDTLVLALQAITLILLIALPVMLATIALRKRQLGLSWRSRIVEFLLLIAICVLWWTAVAFDLVNFSTSY